MNTNTTPSGADAPKTERESFAAWIRTHEDEHGAVDDASAWAGWAGRVALSTAQEDALDAARYRWLRKRWARLDESYADGGPKITSLRVLTDQEVKDEYGWDVDPESLDAAIDAAMKGGSHD